MSSVQTIDRKQFLANVLASGLLSEVDFAAAVGKLPKTNRGRLVARSLVDQGLLTRFQAELLLAGRVNGFHLGQYRILDQLGRGGMGRVFKAEHQTMKRIVALKVLATDVLSTERAQELFLREVRVVARLTHPNVVTAYDANEVGGRFFLVLEYVNGPNLEQLVRKQGPLSVGLACDYIGQIANGLQAAHALGMVHRDLKPANILVQQRGPSENAPGLIKISDFGLARLQVPNADPDDNPVVGTILVRENTVMGTPDFLSPEQARNLHKTDIRSDIYSLGCTFYYLLTGWVPFPGGKTMEKLIRHSAEEPRPVTLFRSDVPEPVLAILNTMMAKRPADRYQTPAELGAALEPYAVSGPIPWAPPSTASLPEIITETGEIPPADSFDDMPALTTTVSQGNSPTPVQTPPLSPVTRTGKERHAGKQATLWIWLCAAAIFGLVAGALVVGLVLN